jgi:hypothetical protein
MSEQIADERERALLRKARKRERDRVRAAAKRAAARAARRKVGTGPNDPSLRMAQRSLDLIEAMYVIAEKAQPITGRAVGYKLVRGSPDQSDVQARHAAGLSPAENCSRARHHPVVMDC